MALDATGTPTSPDSIPKYNTAVDAPSGKGFNAAMDQIQVALDGHADKPAGIVSGEVPVWNGLAWARSSVTRLGATSLGSGSPSAANFLRGDGSWAIAAPLSYRKNTSKTVTNTVAATDLLNGEITVAANALTATGILRLTAWGTYLQNSGATQALLRIALALGGITLVDTNTVALIHTSNVAANPWKIVAIIEAQNATNVQFTDLQFWQLITGGNTATTFATGSGLYWAPVAIGGYSHSYAQGFVASSNDMTAAQALTLNVTMPVANVAVTTILQGAIVEIL